MPLVSERPERLLADFLSEGPAGADDARSTASGRSRRCGCPELWEEVAQVAQVAPIPLSEGILATGQAARCRGQVAQQTGDFNSTEGTPAYNFRFFPAGVWSGSRPRDRHG